MSTKDPINQRLKETRTKRGLSVPQLAELLGLPMDRVYKWEQGKGTPKYADRQKLIDWIENPDWKKIPDGKKAIPVIPEGATESDYLKAILALTESNKGLQETNQTVTNTNRVIADTNALLAQRLVNNQPTAAGDRETFDETVATVIALKESLIEISAGIKKVSKVDATKDFHNKVRAAMNRIGNKGSHVVAGKQST